MVKIYKYPVPVKDEFTVPLPVGAKVLSVQMQRRQPTIWALVETEAALQERRFAVRGTGHDAEGLQFEKYIGTWQMHDGDLVFHLFERE
jgi:hypothetical protein